MKNQCSSWEKSGLRANSTWCLSLSFPNTLKVLKHHRGHDQKPYHTFSKKPVAKVLTIITIFFFFLSQLLLSFIPICLRLILENFLVFEYQLFWGGSCVLCRYWLTVCSPKPCMRNFVFCQLLNNISSSILGHWQIFQSENGSWTPFP